jgi:ribosomal protein S2
MLQKQALDGSWNYAGVELMDETFVDIPTPERERSMRSVQVIFRVLVDNIVTRYGGPPYPTDPDPMTQPGTQWPDAETADVTVVIEGEGELP